MSIHQLFDGYSRFRDDAWPGLRDLFTKLADGQDPHTMLISCAHSRVDPQQVFDASPGEMFVVRNEAALCPPYQPDGGYHGTSAALEFAVNVLKVNQIVVMGHARCGGCKALLSGAPDNYKEFVDPWMRIAGPAEARAQVRAAVGADSQRACEEETIRETLSNLMSFPFVAEKVMKGDLGIHGFWFDVATGELWNLGANGSFQPSAGQRPPATA